MKRLFIFIMFLCMLFITACSKVPAGNVGIKVYLLGGSKGVESEELGVGRYYIGINEELYLFPTFKQNYVWTANKDEGSPNDESITFQTSEGLTVNADIGITYSVDPEKVSLLFQKYRKGIDEITDIFMRNNVRDALNKIGSKYKVESVYGEGKAKLIEEVNNLVQNELVEDGLLVEKIYLIGEFRLPDKVVTALNMKIEAIQRAEQREYELREAEAEAKKKIAIAQAESEEIRLRNKSLTPLLVEYEMIKKWNGVYPLKAKIISGSSAPLIVDGTDE
jgi:regulator of protease activity HflC (stomatin/prohibitin superfamily)